MTFLNKVLASQTVRTKTGQVTIKGPTWVKPSFKSFKSEWESEDESVCFAAEKAKPLADWYAEAKVLTLEPGKIQAGSSDDPQEDIPVEWLLDPDAMPDREWDDSDSDHRYSSRHHDGVLKKFKDGGELDMPIVYYFENGGMGVGPGGGYAVSGRHRITYARSFKMKIEVLAIDGSQVKKLRY